MTQPIDAQWHTITNTCQDGHNMTLLEAKVSRHGNLNFRWICIKCAKEVTDDIRNVQAITNDCCELDMLSGIKEAA